ncbi:collectin-10 isoform X2 [Syngnathoides biaculeatus]|uniref:collectin-10 isoform X2 n=1 Tax=Syngnathoides biaculeatus TaxID=300417 RepID=UPI002ADE1A1E|nr:collectin-10 isoform X2 [Syngnathoides biaculeatus]
MKHHPCLASFVTLPIYAGDQGDLGNEGDEGGIGKNGPPGHPGTSGEAGLKGDVGHMGKTGPDGEQGDKGDTGLDGPSGLKGVTGTTCDCGKYRRVLGQMDVFVGKLRNALKFVKKIMLGLTESDERYYLLVKEAKNFKEASTNCKLRGGALAVPNTVNSNRLVADYVSQSGLSRVYVGFRPNITDTLAQNGGNSSGDADSIPPSDFASDDLTSASRNASCVELLSTGTWNRVPCDTAMFFICEFPKGRIRRGGRGGAVDSTP